MHASCKSHGHATPHEVREAISRTGTDPRLMTRAEMAAYLQSELERWTPVIRSRNIKPDSIKPD